MLFHSLEYIYGFLPIVATAFFLLGKYRYSSTAKYFLILSSLVFYSWWNIYYLPLLLTSLCFNHLVNSYLVHTDMHEKSRLSKKTVFSLGLFANMFLLAYFKYMDFIIINFNDFFGTHIQTVNLDLPLGISFFTIQQIIFLVDTYEGINTRTTFPDYLLFITFFPQLIIGPIVHRKETMPQFLNLKSRRLNANNIIGGLFLFGLGLIKKVALADSLEGLVFAGFNNISQLTTFEAWITSLAFTLQLYFDFSGYTDMALGSALIFNINLPINFNSPYKAKNVIEFWNRWHITFTNFLTTYIYSPIMLAFRKATFVTFSSATMIALLTSAMWHGASWTFVIFGLMHGVALVMNHAWRKIKKKLLLEIPDFMAWAMTFTFITVSMAIFRANTLHDATDLLKIMVGMDGKLLPNVPDFRLIFESSGNMECILCKIDANATAILVLGLSILIAFFSKNSMELSKALKNAIK